MRLANADPSLASFACQLLSPGHGHVTPLLQSLQAPARGLKPQPALAGKAPHTRPSAQQAHDGDGAKLHSLSTAESLGPQGPSRAAHTTALDRSEEREGGEATGPRTRRPQVAEPRSGPAPAGLRDPGAHWASCAFLPKGGQVGGVGETLAPNTAKKKHFPKRLEV